MNRFGRAIAVASAPIVLIACSEKAGAQSYSLRSYAFGSVGGTTASASHAAIASGGSPVVGSAGSSAYEVFIGFPSLLNQRGPTGSLPAASGPAGAAVTITALLQDDQQVIGARLYHRKGGDTDIIGADMTEVSPGGGEWQATIPASSMTKTGVQYFVEARDASFTTRIPPSGFASLAVGLTNLSVFDLQAETYALAGLPMVAANDDPLAVFDELGSYDISQWRYGTWNGNAYVEGADAADASPGQGFWIIARGAQSIRVTGQSTDLSGDYSISLRPGFNQIANPFFFDVPFSSVVLPAGVVANLHGHDGSGYVPFQTTLQPGKGYWIQNTSASPQIITIPAGAPIPPSGRSADPRPWALTEGEEGWSIQATALAGDRRDAGNRFGMRGSATDDRDGLDFSDAPNPPGDFVGLSFRAEDGSTLLIDYRSVDRDGATWTMELSTDLRDAPYRVEFEGWETLPVGWRLQALGAYGTVEWDLRDGHVLRGTSGSTGAVRSWHLVAGSPSFVERISEDLARAITDFDLTVGPNPFRRPSGTSVALAVPEPTHVDLRVYDIRGRLVRTLLGGPLDRGIHRVTWTGKNDSGRAVAAGVYFVRAKTGEFETVRKVLILR